MHREVSMHESRPEQQQMKLFGTEWYLSLIHISEPTRPERISYAVFCLKKKNEHVRSDLPTHHDIVKQYRKGLTAVVDKCLYISDNPTHGTTLLRKVLFVAVLVETRAC